MRTLETFIIWLRLAFFQQWLPTFAVAWKSRWPWCSNQLIHLIHTILVYVVLILWSHFWTYTPLLSFIRGLIQGKTFFMSHLIIHTLMVTLLDLDWADILQGHFLVYLLHSIRSRITSKHYSSHTRCLLKKYEIWWVW